MKRRPFKKALSLLLSVLMVVSIIPTFSTIAAAGEESYYLFTYFTDNSYAGQQVRFAVSTDGLNFNALNNNNAVFMAPDTDGTGSGKSSQGCARDHYTAKGQDGYYYMIATDLDAYAVYHRGFADDTRFYVWRNTTLGDLTDWTMLSNLDVTDFGSQLGDGTSYDWASTIRAWAPQFIWDNQKNAYMVYWSNYLSNWECRVVYSYTTDFVTFTTPKTLYKANVGAAIDEDIIYDSENDIYYMYYKDESSATICYVTSKNLTGPYSQEPIKVYNGDTALEGADCHYAADGTLTMFADAYGDGYFVALQSSDYKNFTVLDSSKYSINQLTPRHGSVTKITKSEYDGLIAEYGVSNDSDIKYYFTNPISNADSAYSAWYLSGINDASGYQFDICHDGDFVIKKGYISLKNSNIFINDSRVINMMKGSQYSVSFTHTLTDSAKSGCTMFSLSNPSNDFILLKEDGSFYINSTKYFSTEVKVGVEYDFTITYNGSTVSLYKNGELVGSANTTVGFTSGFVAFGFSDVNNVSRTTGVYSNLRFRNYALTQETVAKESAVDNHLIYQDNSGIATNAGRINSLDVSQGILADKYYDGASQASAYTVSAWYNAGNNVDGKGIFSIGMANYADGVSRYYLTVLEDGRIYYNDAPSDNHHYADITKASTGISLNPNTWYNITVNVVPHLNYDYLYIYVNGALTGTVDTSAYNIADGNYSIHDYLLRAHDVYLGTEKAHWGGSNNGYIDDFRIYNTSIDTSAFYTAGVNEYNAENAVYNSSYPVPSLTPSNLIGVNDTVTATVANGYTGKYTIEYEDGSVVNGTTSSQKENITVFGDGNIHSKATVTLACEKDGKTSPTVREAYTLLNAPSFNVADNDYLSNSSKVMITANNKNVDGLQIQYSLNGTSWENYTAPITPFSNNSLVESRLYARAVNGSFTSKITQVNLLRENSFVVVSSDGEYFNENSTITAVNANDSYNGDFKYVITVDGSSEQTLDSIDCKAFAGATVIKVYAYFADYPQLKTQTKTFINNSNNFSFLAYQESFNENPANASLASNASVVGEMGIVDSNNNSHSYRKNVLKISASEERNSPYFELNENPLSTPANKQIAAEKGVTVSFWRYVDADSVGNWVNGFSFYQPTALAGDKYYFDILPTGYVTRSDGANDSDNTKNDFVDIKPNPQDNTVHATGNDRGKVWLNIAVTVDPNKTSNNVMVYTNGVYHDVAISTGGAGSRFASGNDAVLAKNIINFLTDENTKVSIGNGHTYWLNPSDTYYDDIRLYTKALTQTDINNMYVDENADVQNSFSTSHDPTNVTVYTLTDSKQVGIEYIEKNNIPESQIAKRDYYSFGTGMTIYHSTDNVHWSVVGDSQGRCGYENQDLFGAQYTSALSVALDYAKTDADREGAGYLVWAPHIMYNLALDKWVYYGSTSSWGSKISEIFMGVSDNVTGPYTNIQTVQRSDWNSATNAIDACVYYSADYSSLYMAYGSWNNAIYVKQLNPNTGLCADGTTSDGTQLAKPLNTDLEQGNSGGSGEGAYVVYDNGYYYLYLSFGQNEGNYVERVYRSTSPDSGFVGVNGVSALDSTATAAHGSQILAPFYLPIYDYMFASTGHSSAYKAVNNYGEAVTLNSAHARPYSYGDNKVAMMDNAMSTCQSGGLSGNIALTNQIAYSQNGWPVLMPYQYSNADTVKHIYNARDLEGTFTANNLQTSVWYNYALPYTYSVHATGEKTGVIEGMKDGNSFRYAFEISTSSDGTCLINYTDSLGNVIWEGVLGQHGGKNIQLGLVNPSTGEHSWAYKSDDKISSSCGEKIYVTYENMFSFDKFVTTASAPEKTNFSSPVTYDTVNKTITVSHTEGTRADDYTNHDTSQNIYKIPVTPGVSYTFEFDVNSIYSQVFVFPQKADNSQASNWADFNVRDANVKLGNNKLVFTAPNDAAYVTFRFGTFNSTAAVDVTFSNIRLYETDRAQYVHLLDNIEKSVNCGDKYGELYYPQSNDQAHFASWYLDSQLTVPVNKNTVAYHNAGDVTVLYSKWDEHTFAYNSNAFTCSCGNTPEQSFDNYNALAEVLKTLDKNKYNDAGLAVINSAISDYEGVLKNTYTMATASNIQADIDGAVAGVLNAINTCNNDSAYINTFTAKVTVDIDAKQYELSDINKYYSEIFEFNAADISPTATVVKWCVTSTDNNGNATTYTVNGKESVSFIANSNLNILVVMTDTTQNVDSSLAVKIKDAFGRTVDVKYADSYTLSQDKKTLSIDGNTVIAGEVPFYEFNSWRVNESNGEVVVTPVYNIKTQAVITVPQGTVASGYSVTKITDTTYSVKYDTQIKLDSANIADFYAWAVKDTDATYQIVSYNAVCTFNAVDSEVYVPVTLVNGVYYVDGVIANGSNIQGAKEIGALDLDASVAYKLENKLPFIYIQSVKMIENNTKARVYGRFTEGSAVAVDNYGVLYGLGNMTNDECTLGANNVYSLNLSNALETGQFLFGIKNANGFTYDVSFKVYANYSYDYQSQKINTIDYTGVEIAQVVA